MIIFKKLYKAKNSPLNSQSLETTKSRSGAVTNSQMFFWNEFSLLERLCACSVAQSHLTLLNPMDCSLPGFSVHGILQARILEQVAVSNSRGSARPRDRTHVSCTSWCNWQNSLSMCHLGSQEDQNDPIFSLCVRQVLYCLSH